MKLLDRLREKLREHPLQDKQDGEAKPGRTVFQKILLASSIVVVGLCVGSMAYMLLWNPTPKPKPNKVGKIGVGAKVAEAPAVVAPLPRQGAQPASATGLVPGGDPENGPDVFKVWYTSDNGPKSQAKPPADKLGAKPDKEKLEEKMRQIKQADFNAHPEHGQSPGVSAIPQQPVLARMMGVACRKGECVVITPNEVAKRGERLSDGETVMEVTRTRVVTDKRTVSFE